MAATTTTTTTIPFDILESIVDLVAGEAGTYNLKAISQTCHSMVPLCRKHLFSSIRLPKERKGSQSIGDLLSASQDIACYIRKLNYFISYRPSSRGHDGMALNVLKEHSCLTSISLGSGLSSDWHALPASVQSSLVSLLQLHTITHLDIASVRNFPRSALFFSYALKSLKLRGVRMVSDELIHLPMRRKIPAPTVFQGDCHALAALLQTTGPDAGPTIDFSLLKDASFIMITEGDRRIVEDILTMATQLESLFITLSTTSVPSLAITQPNNTLKSVGFLILIKDLEDDSDDYDPLCGVNNDLRKIAGRNTLEELEIIIEVDYPFPMDSRDWSNFDIVLTGPGFSSLRRVKLKFRLWSEEWNEQEKEDMLNSVTKCLFPKLSESTSFTFEVAVELCKLQ